MPSASGKRASACHKTALRLAEAGQTAAADAGASSGTQDESGVVDAEFEEVDKRDRKAS